MDKEEALKLAHEPRWYCIDKTGMATLCVDEDDAKQNAKLAEQDWPRNGPYRAVRLCEYIPPAALPGQEPDAWREFDGEGGYYYRSYEHNEDYCSKWDANNPNHKGWVQPLYTTPPKREWVGLTPEETSGFTQHEMTVVKYVSKVLQEKNA